MNKTSYIKAGHIARSAFTMFTYKKNFVLVKQITATY